MRRKGVNKAAVRVLAAGFLASLALAAGGASAAEPPVATVIPGVRINGDSASARLHGQPTITVDPGNPRHVVVTEREQAPDGTTKCMAHTSYDALVSLRHAEIPVPASCATFGTNQRITAAIGSQSKAYFVADGPSAAEDTTYIPGGRKAYLIPSPDGGVSFGEPIEADPGLGELSRVALRVRTDKPDEVFIARRGAEVVAGGLPFNQAGSTNHITVALSRDGGASFAPRSLLTKTDVAPTGEGPRIALGASDNIYVLYFALPNPNPPAVAAAPTLYMVRSTDDGATWKPPVTVDSGVVNASTEQNNFWPDLAVDQTNGEVFAVWSDERNKDGDVFLRRSTDGGVTWMPAQRISHDAVGNGRFQYRGGVSVAPDGRVDVTYYDAKNVCPGAADGKPCYDTNVLMRSSSDHGLTFGPPLRINTNPFDYRLKRDNYTGQERRDLYASTASSGPATYVAWVDTELGTPEDTNRDIFAGRAQFSPFVRVIPAPKFEIEATPAPPPLPPKPAPPLPPPIPPAAPIVPPQPPPLLSAQAPIPVFTPLVAPGGAPQVEPEPAARPQEGVQEATALPRGRDATAALALGAVTGGSLLAMCLALTAASRPGRRPAHAWARTR